MSGGEDRSGGNSEFELHFSVRAWCSSSKRETLSSKHLNFSNTKKLNL